MSRGKVSNEQRLAAAKACAEGKMSLSEAARRLGVCWTNVREWTARYREKGASAFLETDGNPKYSPEIKLRAVKEYLDGKIVYVLLHFVILLGVIVLPKLVDLINQVRDLLDIFVWFKGIQIIVHAYPPSTLLDNRQFALATIRLLLRNIKKNSNLRNRL